MDNEKGIVDLRSCELLFTSTHYENEEKVIQIIFDNKVIILNEEQSEQLFGCS